MASAPVLGPALLAWANAARPVQVIARPHAGRFGKVYSDWQGDSVCVDLGAEAATD